MCGICGFTRAGDCEEDRAVLKAMCSVMAHRGPDGEGCYLADGVALGHRRLSLIDLAGGGQPMIRSTGECRANVFTPAVALEHERGREPVSWDGAMHGGEEPAGELAEPERRANPGRDASMRGLWSIVFNGEIYNYRELRDELETEGYEFATDSDTEVLLVGYIAWREQVLQRVRGMFAFAIFDAAARELFCARDFFGIKPFYYTMQDGCFVFASEIKSILEHPAYERSLNERALAQYLCFQFSALNETLFEGIYKLSPGHFLRVGIDDASLEVKRYWRPLFLANGEQGEREAADAIDDAIRESVRYHNVADVEVGSFLSSGIDSSYLAACLTRENPQIKTFTVGFSEYKGERDEVSWARELAQQLGVENDSHHVSEEEFWEVLPLVQWHMDEPSADPSAVALYFVDRIAARRVKAVLSGEGADELFGGYRIYQAPLANKHVDGVPKPLLRAGSKVLHMLGQRGANYLERASEQVEDWYYTNANGVAFTPQQRDCVLAPDVLTRLHGVQWPGGAREAIGLGDWPDDSSAAGAQLEDGSCESLAGMPAPWQLTAPVYSEAAGLDEVTRMQYVDLWFWIVGDILLKTDKMSMAHSLESRVPFLDKGVFQVAASLPTSLKVSEGQTKLALREAASRAIPQDWAQKQKLGFPVPIASWLRDERRYEQVKDAFCSPEAARFFQQDELLRLLEEHRAGADHSRRIWIIYSFLVWYRVYFVDQAKPSISLREG